MVFLHCFFQPIYLHRLLQQRSWLLTINAVTLGYLLFGIGQLVIIKVAPLSLASSFLLVLLTNKLLGPKMARDRQQLILLSLLQMVITTALSTNLAVGILLVLYGLILPLALTSVNFQQARERLASSGQGTIATLNTRGQRKLRLIMLTTGVGILTSTMLFFLFVPRLGFGLFAANPSQGTMTGFSGRVQLGDFGRIKINRKPVMRVRVKDPKKRQQGRPYWRGISLDRYEKGNWSKSFEERRSLRIPRQGFLYLDREQAADIEQEIFLEPLNENVIFGLSPIIALSRCSSSIDSVKTTKFFQDQVGDLFYKTTRPQTLRYCLRSQSTAPTADMKSLSMSEYQRHRETLSSEFKRAYFQLPKTSIPTLDTVLEKLNIQPKNVFEYVSAVESYLEKNYRYTLERKTLDASSPMRDFLLQSPEGHCEYFASAMVLLLRRSGIAARLVNGFAGGSMNSIGNYRLVHQGNAHSWVEVFFPIQTCEPDGSCTLTATWQAFDPTPSIERTPETKSWWQDFIDATRMRWTEYVVRYNLKTQLKWMSALFEWIAPPQNLATKESRPSISSKPQSLPEYTWLKPTLISLVVLMVLIFIIQRYMTTNRKTNSKQTELAALYKRFTRCY